MNVKPEYIRQLYLPDTDEPFKTLPVEKRLFLVWVVNPGYAGDQIVHYYTSLAAAIEGWTAYTVPESYNFQLQAISASSDSANDVVTGFSLNINGQDQPVFLSYTGGPHESYMYAMATPMIMMKPADTVNIQFEFANLGHVVTTKILGWLYEVALENE